MTLRSHTQGASSSKGKEKIRYVESSDEDGCVVMASDSDYEGEGLLLQENISGVPSDINSLGIDKEQFLCNLPKKRKTSSSKSSAEESLKAQVEQEEVKGETRIDIETGEYTEPIELANSQVVVEKPGRQMKSEENKQDKPILIWEDIEEEHKKWIAENLETDRDLINQNEMGAETVEPSDDLIVPLLRYQKEWLAWSLNQENSPMKGGILADEMGMGKTLEAIALVLLKRKISRGICRHEGASSSCFSNKLLEIKSTLVICPLVAVKQWVNEIARFTSKGSTKVLVYHGANRDKNCFSLSEYDFVITTYSIVEAEFRKYVKTSSIVDCGFSNAHECRAYMTKCQLNQHFKELYGIQWIVQSTCHNDGKKPDSSGDKEMEIRPQGKAVLHSVFWERIILDEAHYIKRKNSKTTIAVLGLMSHHKWALTGTPLHNRAGELYSLVRFLQMFPYSHRFCKDCNCCTLEYRNWSTLVCEVCGHKKTRHLGWWNEYIASPIRDPDPNREAMLVLKNRILKNILLRRTKKGRAVDLALPPKIVTVRRYTLDAVEQDYYRVLYHECLEIFNQYEGEDIAGIFFLVMRLRQTLDHPYLVEYSLASKESKSKGIYYSNDIICSLCHDSEGDIVVTLCGHVFCKPCLIDFGASMGQTICPYLFRTHYN